ncbi:MAG: hydroxymethylglutaryl-CoA lyase [Luteitalea sp.]|nr:hydroxymethylglutaryl-CoA lyase [Luteitalea sp.]
MRPSLPSRVSIVEVGPRDGLQNERAVIPPEVKATFIGRLADAGLHLIEAGAFVSPRWVPQMADTAEVIERLPRRPGVRLSALVPNLKGMERALAAGVQEIAIFAAASETFSHKNLNQGIDASLAAYAELCARAIDKGLRVRGYLSTAFGCPYEGPVAVERVLDVTERLLDMGAVEVSVSDTIGVAHPGQVHHVLDRLLARLPRSQVALHFHDTRGTALANVLAALEHDITTFDASAGGLGGCPYAPGATGNLATEDLLYVLDGLRVETGVNLAALVEASAFIEPYVGHRLPSRYYRAIKATATRSQNV